MRGIGIMLSVAWVSALSACTTMGGIGGMGWGGWHSGGMSDRGDADHGASREVNTPWRYAEASNGDLTIALSFPAPSGGAAVPIEARLRTESDDHALAAAYVWLRIRTPDGNVDHIRMQPVQSAAARTYQAQFTFRTAGPYVVTAEGRTGTGADAHTVSVSIAANVGSRAHGGDRGWLTPAAVVGGLYMVVMMAFM